MVTPMRLYHYACAHTRKAVGTRGMLQPHPQPVLGGLRVLWLTDQEVPDREGLGLTSLMLDCDRIAYRYIVDCDAVRYLDIRMVLHPMSRMTLETVPGARPDLWWMVSESVLGVLDRTYVQSSAPDQETA